MDYLPFAPRRSGSLRFGSVRHRQPPRGMVNACSLPCWGVDERMFIGVRLSITRKGGVRAFTAAIRPPGFYKSMRAALPHALAWARPAAVASIARFPLTPIRAAKDVPMPHDREMIWNYWSCGLPGYEIPEDDPIWWKNVSETLYDYSYRFAIREGQEHWDAMATALECVTGVGQE